MSLFRRSTVRARTIRMLGTRGVPAQYGGFETAAENVGRHLAAAGWRVIIYCQTSGVGPVITDSWHDLERVIIPVPGTGPGATARFDLAAARHAARYDDVCLVFGYNTAAVNLLQRLRRIPLIFNMDGLEWQRTRWGVIRRSVLYAGERIAALAGNELIADHPVIESYLQRRAPANKITMIPYGADAVSSAPTAPVRDLGLEPGGYFTVICRPLPENSILEIVRGFSVRHRGAKLAILGDYDGEVDDYHRRVRAAAGPEVVFLGSIYRAEVTRALRFHSLGYLHGHTVGGTNPSLVEAMAAGNPVIAHDNPYNRWVADAGARYFRSAGDIDHHLEELLSSPERAVELGAASRRRHAEFFTWERISAQYEQLAARYVTDVVGSGQPASAEC